jgi:hypothetical protein
MEFRPGRQEQPNEHAETSMKLLQYFVVAIVLLEISSSHPHASAVPCVDSVDMAPPEGYVEINPVEYQEYIASLSAEAAYHTDYFLQLFVKNTEFYNIQQFDVDNLTSTIILVSHNNEETKKYNDELNKLSKNKNENTKNITIFTEGEQIFIKKANLKRIKKIHTIHFNSENTIEYTEKMIDYKAVDAWFAKNNELPQHDFDLGIVKKTKDYAAYSWLQSARNNFFFSYGMLSADPVLVTYVTIPIAGKKYGIIFSDKTASSQAIHNSIQKAINYAEKNNKTLSIIKSYPHQIVTESYNVLSFAAREWYRQKKYTKSAYAFKLLIAQNDEIQFYDSKISYGEQLALCYLAQKNYEGILNEMPVLLAEAQNMPGATESVGNLHYFIGLAFLATGTLDEAEKHFIQSLAALVRIDSASRLSVQYDLARCYLKKNKLFQAKQFSIDSIISAIELQESKWIPSLFELIIASEVLEKNITTIVFYYKIAAAALFFHIEDGTDVPGARFNEKIKTTIVSILQRDAQNAGNNTFDAVLQSPNTPQDTPFNKGRSWMRGPEIGLYAKYGELARQLAQAAESGSQTDREAARKAFTMWFNSVSQVLSK